MATSLPPFDPQGLACEGQMGGRMTLSSEPVETSRARFMGIFDSIAPLIPPPTDAVKSEDIKIEGVMRVRIYKPTAPIDGLRPVGLFIHAGGWYTGSIEAEDAVCRYIAEKTGIMLFSPDYRLAPENPHPAGLDDVCTAYEFMHKNAEEHGGDNSRKVIMGGSAGATLTAGVALKYSSQGELKPVGVVFLAGACCEPSVMPEEYKQRYKPELYSDAPMVGNQIVRQAQDWLAAPADDPSSSLLHPDIKLLPKVSFGATTKDPLHQETVFFYEECRKQSVDARLKE